MAIDLFVNFERYSNNSLFYRVTASSPSTFVVKLSDVSNTDGNLDALYYVEYSINNTKYNIFTANSQGEFILPLTFDTSLPCICSISVNLTSIDARIPSNITMYGRFLSSMPMCNDFVAYPSLFVDLFTGTAVNLTSANHITTSRGLFFYGEGHTEVINLSCNASVAPSSQVRWFVGNTLQDLYDLKYYNSFYEIRSVNQKNTLAEAIIPTKPGENNSLPISVWLTTQDNTLDGPIISYNDDTGAPEFYPFFASSQSAGRDFFLEERFKSNIKILPYPNSEINLLANPFEDSNVLLPLDTSYRTYTATLNNINNYGGVITEKFVQTQWEIAARPRRDSQLIGWTSSTLPLEGCKRYQFKLAYQTFADRDQMPDIVPFYKTSYDFPTTVTLTVSTTKTININLSSDWIPRNITMVDRVSAMIGSIPSSKIYTPKYFNVKGETVHFSLVDGITDPYTVLVATVSSSKSKDVLYLNTETLTGTMVFDTLGSVDLVSNATYLNTRTDAVYQTRRTYTDVAEIIKTYDVIADEGYFHTASTPIYLPYIELPKITPNEWATNDIVNDIITKLYKTTEALYDYSSIYVKKDIFYGFLIPFAKKLITEGEGVVNPNVFTWFDFDCSNKNVVERPAWIDFQDIEPENTWEYQSTSEAVAVDPSCFQKHCTKWNWKWRTKLNADFKITWKDARSTERYAKKWKYEKCVADIPINCNYVNWQISTDPKQKFILPSSRIRAICTFVDADVFYGSDKIVFARTNELFVANKGYLYEIKDRAIMADDLFTFQSIAGISTTKDDKIVVLDSLLPRVSVFDYVDNDIILKEAWGSYGKQTNPAGLNQPADIHVDKYNSIWIADSGNKCVKKFTIIGKPLLTLTHALFESEGILSVCVDVQDRLHCLTAKRVVVFDSTNTYLFDYVLDAAILFPTKINVSFNKEMIYVTYKLGIAKYFRNGIFSHFTLQNVLCNDGEYLENYNSVMQDKFRNLYVVAEDKLLHLQDIQQTVELKASINSNLYWKLPELMVHKEEYIQPWVYLKSFHRLWDNIELLRTALFYSITEECKTYVPPTFAKEDLIIGQNEIVTNSTLNRLSEQLWTNLQSLVKYFDPSCKK